MTDRVLIVDDEPGVLEDLRRALQNQPYEILVARSAEEALGILGRRRLDVVISDLRMPGMDGAHFLATIKDRYPETIRMLATGHATLQEAMTAINEGEVYRFFVKPYNPVDLAQGIRQALLMKDLLAENQRLRLLVERQTGMLEKLEQENPGITRVERDEDGAVVIEEEDIATERFC